MRLPAWIPPRQWAGRPRAVEFVRSLGFGEEWAGEPNTRREPFVEVDGPHSLPELHDYQRSVVGNVRNLIRSGGALGERRGMISMPTGSGKTRVAVQAIVEAIRGGRFQGRHPVGRRPRRVVRASRRGLAPSMGQRRDPGHAAANLTDVGRTASTIAYRRDARHRRNDPDFVIQDSWAT